MKFASIPNVITVTEGGSERLPSCPITPPDPEQEYTYDIPEQLAAIPGLLTQLGMFLEPGSVPPDPEKRKAAPSPARLPVRLDVIDLLDLRLDKPGRDNDGERDVYHDHRRGSRRLGVLGTLWLWVLLVDCEQADATASPGTSDEDLPGEDAVSICGWLYDRVDWIIDNHGLEFEDEIAWMHLDLLRACGVRPPFIIKCPWCANKVQGVDNNAWFKCLGCEKTWVWDAEIRRLGATQPPATLQQISKLLNIPLKLLKQWERENRFLPVGHAKQVPLYEVEHVRKAANKVGPVDDFQPGRAVAAAAGVPWSTLRWWEQQDQLRSVGRNRSGLKLYSLQAVKNLVAARRVAG